MNPLMNPVGSNAEGKLNCINAVVITQKTVTTDFLTHAHTHPAQSSFGKLSRNDTVNLYSLSGHRLKQWGQLGEILGGVRFPEG